MSPKDAAAAVRSFPRRYRGLLVTPAPTDSPDAVFRRRPRPAAWSALEHTAHVADRLDHLGTAIFRVTRENTPAVASFDNDERATAKGYNDLDRIEVLGWLELAAGELASVIDGVRPDDWMRTALVAGAGERDALTLARDGVHEGAHHLRDIRAVLDEVRGRPAG
ncbi:MAG: DinB family protein [Acidimicrobiales bacterium]